MTVEKFTIREQQLPKMIEGFGPPSALLKLTTEGGKIGFHVFLWWKRDREMQLQSLQGEPRVFKHFGRFLKWAAQHEVTLVEVEGITLTSELKEMLGRQADPADDEEDNQRRSGGPDILPT
jgi:hypothetical protein